MQTLDLARIDLLLISGIMTEQSIIGQAVCRISDRVDASPAGRGSDIANILSMQMIIKDGMTVRTDLTHN